MINNKYSLLALFTASIFIFSSCGNPASSMDSANMKASYSNDGGFVDNGYFADEAVEEDTYTSSDDVSGEYASEGSETDNTSSMPDDPDAYSADSQDENTSASKKLDREKIVYHGNVSIETLEWEESKKLLEKTIEKFDGIIQSENEYTNSGWDYSSTGGTRVLNITLRIPSDNFKKFMKSTGDIGSVTSKSSNAENITGDYYDTKARLDTYQAEMDRLLVLLDSATKMSDILKIESKISDLQYQIDSTRSRLENMDMDVAYSTVDISLEEVKQYTAEESTWYDRVIETLQDSLEFFLNFLHILVIGVLYLGPCLVVIVLILLGIRKLVRKFYKGSPGKKPTRFTFFKGKKQEAPEASESEDNSLADSSKDDSGK